MRRRGIGSAVITAVVFLAALLCPAAAAKGVGRGLEICLSTAIPSLFPMMFASVMAVETGWAQRLGRCFAPLTRRLFALPGESGSALLIALLGGYPAGAKAVAGLYERGAINHTQARRMALFCFCAGPAFLLGAVGALCGRAAGAMIMLAQAVSVLLLGVLSRFTDKDRLREKHTETHAQGENEHSGIADAAVSSAGRAAEAILSVCTYTLLFSAAGSIMEQLGISGSATDFLMDIGVGERAASAVIPVLLEVTSGSMAAAGAGLPLVAFAAGFGGLSVQLQVLSIYGGIGVRRGMFFLARMVQGLLSAALTAAMLVVMPSELAVAASTAPYSAQLSGSAEGGVTLVIMCVMYVLCLPDEKRPVGGSLRRVGGR